eukprot:1157504-Rhodomonas_salina.3
MRHSARLPCSPSQMWAAKASAGGRANLGRHSTLALQKNGNTAPNANDTAVATVRPKAKPAFPECVCSS